MARDISPNEPTCGDKAVNPCRDCSPKSFQSLKAILSCFKSKWSKAVEVEWFYYRMEDFSDKTLRLASRASLKGDDKKHSHQFRIPNAALDEAEKIILSLKDYIRNLKNCAELHNLIIEKVENVVSGFGPMSSYDTAVRIGMMLGFEPKFVYLHAGSAEGARAILGNSLCKGKVKLSVREFPVEISSSGFSSDQIESFLCICKKSLQALRENNFR